MISFEKLWITLKERNISQYKLIKEYKISTGQLDRLRKNGNVNTYTLKIKMATYYVLFMRPITSVI